MAMSGEGTQVQPSPQKGPLVFLNYDQAELDACYDQNVWAPNREFVHQRSALACERARARLGQPLRFSYGPTDIETLDVFPAKVENAPIFVYIHGGAWRAGSAALSAAPAQMFVDAGIHYVALDFTNVIETGGNLRPMIEQVRRAMAWLYRNAAVFGGDCERLYVHGHSSGGHLAGNVLTTDWYAEFGLPKRILRAGMVSSGMYDLAPVRLSARSRYVAFDESIVEDFSSIRHIDKISCPVTVTFGTCESPEFQRQNQEFAQALSAAGKTVCLQVADGFNHFELAETFFNPYGILGRTALDLVAAG